VAQVVTHREKLNRIHEEVRQALEADDAVGIVVADGNFADFIAKNDRGLLGKVIVGVAEGIPPVGVLFIKENLGRTSGRYQLFSWSKDDQAARLLVQKVLDKILANGKYDPFQDLPEPTPEQKAAFQAELDSMMDKTTITCSRCGGKNPANSEHCYKCGQAIAGAPNSSGLASVLHEEPQAGTQSLGDLSGCDANKLTEGLRDQSSRLRGDKQAQENALDKPHHLIFYSAVDQHGETRFFDLMPQSDGFSIAETATRAAKLGKCVETIYGDSDGATHHVHRLYGKFYASSARKAMDHFAELTGLSQVTEIAETQTQREALPTWRSIYKKLGAVSRPNPLTQDSGDRKDASNTSREANANVESKGTAKAPLTHEELLNEKTSEKGSSSYKWALVYGWFTVVAAAYLLVVAALKLLGIQASTPPPTPFAHSPSIGTASAMFQGLLWLATGLAILQRRLIAIRLMWAVVILSGLGVLVRGIVPLDLLIWILSVVIAKWFSTKREFLSERGRRSVEMPKGTLVEGQRDPGRTTLGPNTAKTPGQGVRTASSSQGTTRTIASTPESRVSSRKIQREIAIALVVLVVIAILGLALRTRMSAKHPPTRPADNASANPHLAPILIPGVQEPEEMRVEPFPAHVLTEPERMLAEGMNNIKDKDRLDALLPVLNGILAKYPDYGDGYTLRLISLCNGNDHAAILSDINSALKYKSNLENAGETNASMLPMRAKIEHDEGDDVAAMRDLDAYIQANTANADRFTNSGAVAPEKTASACTWSETDMDAIKSKFPNDYRSYLYAGLYYGFFTTWDEKSVSPAIENLNKAAEIYPNSPLPHFFKAHVLRQGTFFKQLNMPDAQRADLNNRFLAELNLALALDPGLLPALSQRADVYFNLKQFQQAISDYDRILALDPKDAGAFNDRGLAKTELGDTYGAISDFGEAITLKKRALQESSSYENRADAYLKTQQWNLAIRDLTTAISLKTGGISLLMNINQFRALYPEYKPASDEAIARKLNQTFYPDLKYEDFAKSFLHDNVEKGFETSTVIPDLYLKRSDAYLAAGDWHGGAADFRRAINGFPQYANAVDRWRKVVVFQDTQLYIDLQTFDDSMSNSVKVWTKQFTASGDTSGPYSLNQYEFDCNQRRLRQISFARYGAFGRLLASRGNGPWESSIPDTLGENLLNHVCIANKTAGN
jgi:tetratricopeptide (TPR) repeat protein